MFLNFLSLQIQAQEKVNYDKILVGTHLFSIQWISLEHFGKVEVKKQNGIYNISGQQRSKQGADYVAIKGTLKPITDKHLLFECVITTKIGVWGTSEPCIRSGTYNFIVTKNRKYWRLQEMDSPCNEGTDYIDIYFLRK